MTSIKRPIIRIHNIETNEIIDTEINDKEFAKYKANLKSDEQIEAEIVANAAAIEAREAQRQVILNRLGLTADEAKLLLG